ncbi:hypothetical protein K036_3991 [Acinetobacter baumannii 42057_5]|nr:hypothetical protein K036_3991 [Acinetobacter baumannii 42057_5]
MKSDIVQYPYTFRKPTLKLTCTIKFIIIKTDTNSVIELIDLSFSSIIYEKSLAQMVYMVLCITILPYIIPMLLHKYYLSPLSIYGVIVGLMGIFITKFAKQNSTSEIASLTILLIIAPLLFGIHLNNRLNTNDLSFINLKDQTSEKWFILDKFSDSFLLINEDKSKLKIIKIEEQKSIIL